MNEKEMQDINGGATYTATCSHCGMTFGASYLPMLLSQAMAKVLCEGRLRNHITEVHYDII